MIKFPREYFNIEDTLYCGQLFRFKPFKDGYVVLSSDKACYLHYDGDFVIIESDYDDYFYNYFDLARDYSEIVDFATKQNNEYLSSAALSGKGIRILNQDITETIFCFLTSQNNNIPRIKRTIEGLCEQLGEKITAFGETFYAFPKVEKIAAMPIEFFKSLGLGYRASYFVSTSKALCGDFLNGTNNLSTDELAEKLLSLKGVGKKVADCILLFAFSRTERFPVDTWIMKLYKENFGGEMDDPKKVATYLSKLFGDKSGFVQQYLFYYKRGK